MERSNFDRDNISQRSHGGRSPHTYTPTSHENLLKSHLQLDAANQAKRRSDLKRLAAENERLKWDLEKALKEVENKNTQLKILEIEQRNKPREPSLNTHDPNLLYEIDGKPVDLDKLIHHFNVIIQRHHDLLNRKNKEIQNLKDALSKKYEPQTRDVAAQSSKPNNEDIQNKLMNDFTKEVALIRKEYEQVEKVLTYRNGKLEGLIQDLQEKLLQYSKEIEQLRKEVAAKENKPDESTLLLLREKEKENKRLKDTLTDLQQISSQKQVSFEDEIKKCINDKKVAVDKINEIISETKKEQSEKPDLANVERDFQSISIDLNNTNNKVNDIHRRLKELSVSIKDDKSNREILIQNLESLKKQCQDEINGLNNQLKKTDEKPTESDDAEIPKQHYINSFGKDDIAMNRLSDSLYKSKSELSVKIVSKDRYKQYSEKGPFLSPVMSSGFIPQSDPFFRHKHHKLEPCEACNEADFEASLKPEIKVSERAMTTTFPSATVRPSSRKLISDFYSPSSPRANSKDRRRQQKKKSGCCGKKESEYSNYQYDKYPENKGGNYNNSEKLIYTHNPYQTNEPPQTNTYNRSVDYGNRYRQ